MAAAAPAAIAGSHKYWHPAVKPGTTKAITTYSQWVSAFSVYAAVLNERYPHVCLNMSQISGRWSSSLEAQRGSCMMSLSGGKDNLACNKNESAS